MVMFISAVPIEVTNIIKQFNELEINADLYESSVVLSSESVRKSVNSEGVRTSIYPFMLQDKAKDFKEKYKEKFNKEPYFAASFGYDIIKLVAMATNGQSMSSDEIAKKILELKTFSSLNGEVEIKPNGEIVPQMFSAKVVDGELEVGECKNSKQ